MTNYGDYANRRTNANSGQPRGNEQPPVTVRRTCPPNMSNAFNTPNPSENEDNLVYPHSFGQNDDPSTDPYYQQYLRGTEQKSPAPLPDPYQQNTPLKKADDGPWVPSFYDEYRQDNNSPAPNPPRQDAPKLKKADDGPWIPSFYDEFKQDNNPPAPNPPQQNVSPGNNFGNQSRVFENEPPSLLNPPKVAGNNAGLVAFESDLADKPFPRDILQGYLKEKYEKAFDIVKDMADSNLNKEVKGILNALDEPNFDSILQYVPSGQGLFREEGSNINSFQVVEKLLKRALATKKGFSCDMSKLDGKIVDEYNCDQATTGDCWFEAGIRSLQYSEAGKERLQSCLKVDKETGTVAVTLRGLTDENGLPPVYNISFGEIAASNELASGDPDVRALEIAAARWTAKHGKPCDKNSYVMDEGSMRNTAMYFFKPEEIDTELIHSVIFKKTDALIPTERKERYAYTVEDKEKLKKDFFDRFTKDNVLTANIAFDIKGPFPVKRNLNLLGHHAYTILSHDTENGVIRLVNPHEGNRHIIVNFDDIINSGVDYNIAFTYKNN